MQLTKYQGPNEVGLNRMNPNKDKRMNCGVLYSTNLYLVLYISFVPMEEDN